MMFMFVMLLFLMSIILNYRNNFINTVNRLNKQNKLNKLNKLTKLNTFNDSDSDLYLCKKYCFIDEDNIWLDHKIAKQVCKNDIQSTHTISKISCNDLVDNINTSPNSIYKNEAMLNFCSAKIISSTINCSDSSLSFEFK